MSWLARAVALGGVFFLGIAATAEAQGTSPPPISVEEFQSITVNDTIALRDIVVTEGDWNALKGMLGTPLSESCEESVSGPVCEFEWTGFSAIYAHDGRWLAHLLTFSDSTWTFGVDETDIRVGDDYSILQQVFPDGYAQRHEICLQGECRWYVAVMIGQSHTSLNFRYDPTSCEILSIEIWSY